MPSPHIALPALILLLVSTVSLLSASQRPKTILDYYLIVPGKLLRLDGRDSSAARESAITVKDVENGYLQIRRHVGEAYTALALFKEPDGGSLVAVENRSCDRGCRSTLNFLQYENERLVDVTEVKLPIIDDITLRSILNKQLTSKDGAAPDFRPSLLYTLPRGGTAIGVSEHWSGMAVGRLAWEDGKFVFEPVGTSGDADGQGVLASASNTSGDRIQIIDLSPKPTAKLPLKGHLRVSVAYELKSAPACFIWVRPVVAERRLPDHFASGAMLHKRGSGVTTGYFGFNNQAHIDRLEVVMADERHNKLLSLTYDVGADWEGVLECPTLRVSCFSSAPDSAVPVGCTVYPSGLSPGQHLIYYWTISNGNITSGHGTHHIKIDTGGEEKVTATVEVGGLGGGCVTNATFTSTAATISRPSIKAPPR